MRVSTRNELEAGIEHKHIPANGALQCFDFRMMKLLCGAPDVKQMLFVC